MSLDVIIIGGGGHARVVLDTLRSMQANVIGYLAPTKASRMPVEYLGDDSSIRKYSSTDVELANGLGSVGSQNLRSMVYNRFKERGYRFTTLIHPAAIVAADAEFEEGCQVMAGSVVQTGVYCGENVLINTRAGVDHDCTIGANTHVSVGVTLSGDVSIGSHVHLGAGSTVIQGISIGDYSVVGAGAVVIADVGSDQTVVGVPARRIVK
ncbi:acetyltransferase [Mariprofundus erugo]|uniref:Acetyltransferase n=1 Tax=Mariprofundus erugo TaxID=2528639 RepID=A0A5R9GNT5_9PROT|nr:acetyltransferase [Mariprofundus erugo]TLS66735.1 acetyltransferase [Mariprofundus erugo]